MTHQTNRRQFLQVAGLASAGFWIAPEILLARLVLPTRN